MTVVMRADSGRIESASAWRTANEREKKGGACDQKTPLNSRKTILRRINKKKMTPNHYVGIVDEEPSIELYATLIFLS